MNSYLVLALFSDVLALIFLMLEITPDILSQVSTGILF